MKFQLIEMTDNEGWDLSDPKKVDELMRELGCFSLQMSIEDNERVIAVLPVEEIL